MPGPKEKFIVNKRGRRVSVILDVRDYQEMLADLEELESIKAYDMAKASRDDAVPFEQAVEEIESQRR